MSINNTSTQTKPLPFTMPKDNYPVDIVCPWVDGNDPQWKKDFLKYAPAGEGDKRLERYRDWDLMRFWFRGIEKFAPWVNRIHFITCGHYPEWLNINSPKLHLVRHEDYIPKEYLPVFNSHPIELCMHKIEGLSERFIYFNDDIFPIKPMKKEDFFKNGLPCDMSVETILRPLGSELLTNYIFNCIALINQHFDKREVIRKHYKKWFSPKYGRKLSNNIIMSAIDGFSDFLNTHNVQPFLKSTFEDVWEKCDNHIIQTSLTRFREQNNVSQYLMRYWQLVQGNFCPAKTTGRCKFISIREKNLPQIEKAVTQQKKSLLCLNDTDISDYETVRYSLHKYFEQILPEKSFFES